MIFVPSHYKEVSLDMQATLEAYSILTERKSGRTWTAKNTITDMGLDELRNSSLLSQFNYVNFVKKAGDTSTPTNPDSDFYVKAVHSALCGGGMAGSAENSQESDLEGWTSGGDIASNATFGDPASQYWEYSRTWSFDPAVAFAFATRASDLGGPGGGLANGGSMFGITNFFISAGAGLASTTLPDECVVPPLTPHQRTYAIHGIAPFWNHAQFKDNLGNPTTVDFHPGSQFDFTYTIRLNVPTTPNVQTININGVDYTITTRAHRGDMEDTWGAQHISSIVSGSATAFEDNTMPAINASKANGGLGSAFATSATLQAAPGSGNYYREVLYGWTPAVANFATGIGCITHGIRNTVNFAVTTISPQLPKSSLQRMALQARYSWSRVGGD